MHAFTYPERLKLLGLERLEERRIRADILFVYKLLSGLTALQADDFLYCVSLHVLVAIPTNWFCHDVQLMLVFFFLSPHPIPSILLASIYLSEHMRVLTLLLTVMFKTCFYRFAFCVTLWLCVRG